MATRKSQQDPARGQEAARGGRQQGQEQQQQQARAQDQQLEERQVEAPTPAGTERTRTRRVYVPRTDIFETEDAIVLVADMPGVALDGLDVTLERRELTIRGRTHDAAPEGYSPVHREYEGGDYERAFTLSEDIDAGKIEARLRDGVLRLTLPKAGPAQARRIQVQAG